MASINDAMEWLKSDLKVRRPMWDSNNFLVLDDNEIRNNYNKKVK